MKPGDMVRISEGSIEKVVEIKDDLIATEGSIQTGTWYSESDLIRVHYSESLKRFVTIPEEVK